MINVAVLASSAGTDLDALVTPSPHFSLRLVICDRDCKALDKAALHSIPSLLLPSRGKTQQEFSEDVMQILHEQKIDLVLLIGYTGFLSSTFVTQWKNKIMNIYPSLLPAFAGGVDLNVHEQVLASGCKVTGATLYFISEDPHFGPIIAQEPVPVSSIDTPMSLKQRVQYVEKLMIRRCVELYARGALSVEDNIVRVREPILTQFQ